MTASQRDAITSATKGLIIFCTDCALGEGELQIKLTSSWKNITGGDVDDPPDVGDFYGGGVVFYIFVDGDTGYVAGENHGLIAAVEDQSSNKRWYNGSYNTTSATGTAIGTGATNTDTIISVQGGTETSYAAGLARAYTGGGYTDWFLPSKEELDKMCENRATINSTASANGGSDFSTWQYWSSSEYNNIYAWSQNYTSGCWQPGEEKDTTLGVRAVRTF